MTETLILAMSSGTLRCWEHEGRVYFEVEEAYSDCFQQSVSLSKAEATALLAWLTKAIGA